MILAITASLAGCATGLNASNFREYISVERRDVTLYSGEYIGPETGCFPPVGNKICKLRQGEQPLYQKKTRLEMEIIDTSMQLWKSGDNGESSDELMFLTAADLAIQRGYKMFTPLETLTSVACPTSEVIDTRGAITPNGRGGGSYSAQSTISSSGKCTGSTKIGFLLFNDKDALKKGVLKQEHSGILASEYVWPLWALYYGSTPGLDLPNLVSPPGFWNMINWPYKGWETHYDAETVSKKLREKYQVNDNHIYNVTTNVLEGKLLDKLQIRSP